MNPIFIKYGASAIGGALVLLTAYSAVKWHANKHYNLGIAYEQAEQAKRDALVPPVKEDLKGDVQDAKDEFTDKREEIRTEVHTGITEAHLARSIADAKQTGRELGRAETIAAYRAKKDACLNSEFADDDQLLLDGLDQQRDIFGDVIRGD